MTKSKESGIILSLGSVNADFQVRVDQQPGSTTTLLSHDFVRLSGGKAANVAFMARRLQAPVLLIARVGDDELKQQALKPLQEAGVDISAVEEVAGTSTAVSMIFVPPDGKKYIVLAPNANDAWEERDLGNLKKTIEKAPPGSVLAVNYEIPPFVVAQAIALAHQRGFSILLDPSPANRVDKALFPKIDYLVPDASETEELTGIRPKAADDALKAGKVLLEQGIKHVLVKLEDGGCVLVAKEKCLHIPPVEVQVTDTTGAGDAFAGALATALLQKKPLQEAACRATAASLAAVTAYGSQTAYPSEERLQEMFERVRDQSKTFDARA